MNVRNGIRWTLLAMLSALSVCATSSTLGGKTTPTATAPAVKIVKLDANIQALYAQFSKAFAARDIETLMGVFDRSAVLSYQGSPDMDYEAIKAGFLQDFKNDPPGTTWSGIPEDFHLEGNLAIVIAHWENYIVSNGQQLRRQRIRSVDVLKRTNGRWRIVRTVNYPEDE